MSFYDDASLIMFPSGYKEDKIYSLKPTDGSGDLTFTRASTATRVNSDGLIETSPVNLMSYSEQFDNGFWIKAASGSATFTVTANQTTAPNGTNTADLISITRSATSELSAIYTSVGQGIGTFKNSIWLKAKDGFNVGKTIDLWSWESDTRGYTKITLTADWVRYEQNTTVFTGSASELFDFGLLPISYSTSTTLAVEFYAWGGQSNIGSTAKPYFPTTDRLNVPRLTYQNGGGGCPSLLLEKQSTNVVTYSEQFDNGAWTKGGSNSVTANAIISPDGTQNADFIVSTATNSAAKYAYQVITSIASPTATIYAKAGAITEMMFYCQNGNGIYFNLTNGAFIAYYGSGSSTITSYSSVAVGNGWYRYAITFNTSVTSIEAYMSVNTNISPSIANGDGFYLWGAQVEASSYPTSYIPTLASSVTRLADAAFKTGISSLIGQTQGTIFVDMNYTNTNNTLDATPFRVLGSGSAQMYVEINTNETFEAVVVNSAGTLVFNSTSAAQLAGRKKIAIAYNGSDFAYYINGTQIAVQTSGAFASASLDSFNLGMYSSGVQVLADTINQAIVFPTRLTNTQLAQLTTI